MSPGLMATSTAYTIEKLDGSNFHAWKFKMRMVLEDKDLWDIVDGSEERPAGDAGKLWDKRARKALATIALSLKDSELVHVRQCKDPKEAWMKLSEVYETKGLANRLFLRRKFFTAQFLDGDSMQSHINKVNTMAEQLEAIGAPVSSDDIAMTLLCSLPESYDNLIVALESRADDLTVEFVTARLLQEEARRKESGSQKADAAFFSKTARNKNYRAKSIRPKRDKSKDKCNYCGKVGHWAEDCYKRLAKEQDGQHRANKASDSVDLFVAANVANAKSKDDWFIDSGATQHLSCNRDWFVDYERIQPSKVYLGDDYPLDAIGKGSIHVKLDVGGKTRDGIFQNVLHVPDLAGNLLSVSKMVSQGLRVGFDDSGCTIRNGKGCVIARAVMERNLYRLTATIEQERDTAQVAKVAENSADLWHQRLGHLHMDGVKSLGSKNLVTGLNIGDGSKTEFCKGCVHGKQQRTPFPKDGGTRASELLELVHTDLCGPMKQTSFGGAKYFITFIDDKSRKTFVYFLKTKDEALARFKEFKALAENQTGKRIKTLRSDNGGEFISKTFNQYLISCGIQRQTTAPYSPEQNGVAERANRTIVEHARSMIHAKDLGYEYWGEAVATATYLKNRSPTRAVPSSTPEEAWTGNKPSVAHLRVFGCTAYAHVPKERRTKLDSKTTKCIFLGYYEGSKAYRLYDPETKKVVKSRDVIFVEQDEPAKETEVIEPDEDDAGGEKDKVETQEPAHTLDRVVKENSDQTYVPRRSGRLRRAPWEVRQDDVYARVAISEEPRTLAEAMVRPDSKQWEQAIQSEYNSIISNGTWTLVKLPAGRKAIGCKWVFKVKYTATGAIEKYKARLVAKGYSQTQGIDYDETFAPVAKFNSIRVLLAIAAQEDFEIHQMDVMTAFLNADLEEDVYMAQPEGFVEKGNEELVCKLHKSLYGLKQASRSWYHKIDGELVGLGFTRSQADHSVYSLQKDNVKIIIALYVDDLILMANDLAKLLQIKEELGKRFDMKDLGEIHYCLGIQVIRDRKKRTIQLGQAKYIENVLKRFRMEDCKPIGTPLDTNSKLTKAMAPKSDAEIEEMQSIPYQSAVGSLMYAMLGTRPDIAYVVGALSQYCSNPGPAHWNAIKRVFRYLKGTINYTLRYEGNNKDRLVGFCDADWAGNVDDRRSTTGCAFIIAGGAVSWNSKKQATVALSSTEAEYMAATQATKEAIWLRKILTDLGYTQDQPTVIYGDNQSCIALTKNPTYHARTKHIDIQHHFVREKVEDGTIKLVFCGTEDMAADVLTKGLSRDKHGRFSNMIGLADAEGLAEWEC
jgi:hypothetical protein